MHFLMAQEIFVLFEHWGQIIRVSGGAVAISVGRRQRSSFACEPNIGKAPIRLSCCDRPRKQVLEPGNPHVGDTAEDTGKLGLWIDRDPRCHDGGLPCGPRRSSPLRMGCSTPRQSACRVARGNGRAIAPAIAEEAVIAETMKALGQEARRLAQYSPEVRFEYSSV